MMLGDVSNPTARKEHVCFWCGEAIAVGESYFRWTWVSDAAVETIKTHPECREAWSTLPPGDDEVPFAEFSRGCTCERGHCVCDGNTRVDD
jgi:hypothetical protein